jgi:hypothetical protein
VKQQSGVFQETSHFPFSSLFIGMVCEAACDLPENTGFLCTVEAVFFATVGFA